MDCGWYCDVRLFFERGLAALYLVAFASALNQFPALLGERGLLPVREFLRHVGFRDAPSVFHWRYSDALLRAVCWIGIALSAITLVGLAGAAPLPVYIAVWLVLWALYLSIVNVGQTFYGFGWESMLVEAGFFAAFLGPRSIEPPALVIVILRWMLFRVEFGAGLIKLRHDQCWRDLTCLYYHYETQPLPNPLSWFFHRIPKPMHRLSVVFSHFVQIVVPFGIFAPQPVASIAAALIILHQLLLIISGNYSWLNWLTVVLAISGFGTLEFHFGLAPYDLVIYALALVTLALSIQPFLNFFSRHQLMNYSWNRLHLVNAYGAFGSITKERYEIVIEGSLDGVEWREYEFKAKPGDPRRMPPQIAPYHLRLDWLMWFLPFSVRLVGSRVLVPGYETWFIRFIHHLLEGDPATLKLLRRNRNPFPDRPPVFIRAGYFLYRYFRFAPRRLVDAHARWRVPAHADAARNLVRFALSDVVIEELHARVDEEAAKLTALHRERLACKRGCIGCCADDLTVFEVEAERIRRFASELLAHGTPHPPGRCAFLSEDGACRVYEARPYVCRTQGLPLRWIDGEIEYRDICELSDGEPRVETLDAGECWTIGPVESELAELNSSPRRVRLRELFQTRPRS